MKYNFNEYIKLLESKEILSEEVTEDGLKRVKKDWEKLLKKS